MNVDEQIRAAAEAVLTSSASSPQPAPPHLRECKSHPYYTYIPIGCTTCGFSSGTQLHRVS
jgi:hypothetical protein